MGYALYFYNNACVNISGCLEIDGNSPNAVIGGPWGDTGYQRAAYGMLFVSNRQVHVENVYTHHNCLDGFAVSWPNLHEDSTIHPHMFVDVTSEYNGRQGLSWVGGNDLKLINCRLRYTGRAVNVGTGLPFGSNPGAGLDIEANKALPAMGLCWAVKLPPILVAGSLQIRPEAAT